MGLEAGLIVFPPKVLKDGCRRLELLGYAFDALFSGYLVYKLIPILTQVLVTIKLRRLPHTLVRGSGHRGREGFASSQRFLAMPIK